MYLTLCFVFAWYLVFAEEIPDICNQLTIKQPIPYEDLKSCLYSKKFNIDVRNQTITALNELYEMNVYRDININSGGDYKIQNDVVQRLENLRIMEFEYDYDFHKQVQLIFNDLKDPHNVYVPPYCYSMFFVSLPFLSYSKLVDDSSGLKQKIFVKKASEIIQNNYTVVYSNDSHFVSEFEDWEILEIDKTDALEFLYNHAVKDNRFARDVPVRFNLALSQFFSYTLRSRPFPEVEGRHFLLKNPKSGEERRIFAKFLVHSVLDTKLATEKVEEMDGFEFFCGYHNFLNGYKKEKLGEEDSSIKKLLEELNIFDLIQGNGKSTYDKLKDEAKEFHESLFGTPNHVIVEQKIRKMIGISGHGFKSKDSPESKENPEEEDEGRIVLEKLIDGPDIFSFLRINSSSRRLYSKDNDTTGIMMVSNFYPSSGDPLSWVIQVLQSLKSFRDNSVTRLIVDLRGNGGGYLCLPFVLIRLLSKYAPEAMYTTGDLINTSPYWKKTWCPTQRKLAFYSFVDEYYGIPNHTAFYDTINRTRGGKVSEYTQLFGIDCSIFNFIFLEGFKDPETGFEIDFFDPPLKLEPDNLVMLTDGSCGSACGIFVTVMKRLGLARVVSQGGVYEKHNKEGVSIGSFKGASVLSSIAVYLRDGLLTRVGCNYLAKCPCHFFTKLPGYQLFTFSWYEIYNFDKFSFFNIRDSFEKVKSTSDDDPKKLLGYVRDTSHTHIWNWNFDLEDLEELIHVYNMVEESGFLNGCFNNEIRRNDECMKNGIENGVYGFPCMNGEFDENRCVLRGCDAGFYLSRDGYCVSTGKKLVRTEMFGMLANLLFNVYSILFGILFLCICGYCYVYSCFGWGVFLALHVWNFFKFRHLKFEYSVIENQDSGIYDSTSENVEPRNWETTENSSETTISSASMKSTSDSVDVDFATTDSVDVNSDSSY